MNKFIFDVDGTLTPSRREIEPDFKNFFSNFCEHNNVYLVTGSDFPKTHEQLGDEIITVLRLGIKHPTAKRLCLKTIDWHGSIRNY